MISPARVATASQLGVASGLGPGGSEARGAHGGGRRTVGGVGGVGGAIW